jgi:hypothetical protein
MNNSKKVGLVISGIGMIVCLISSAYCFARAQYYQGRIDAYDEITEPLIKMRDELETKIKERESKDEAE